MISDVIERVAQAIYDLERDAACARLESIGATDCSGIDTWDRLDINEQVKYLAYADVAVDVVTRSGMAATE